MIRENASFSSYSGSYLSLKAIGRIATLVLLIVIIAVAGGAAYFGAMNSVRSSSSTKSSLPSTSSFLNTGSNTSSCARTLETGSPTFGALAYDSGTGYVYASLSDGLTAINGSTGRMIKNVSLGFNPSFIGYNPGNHLLYATEYFVQKGIMLDPVSGQISNLSYYMTSYTPSPTSYVPYLDVFYTVAPGVGFAEVNASSNHEEAVVKMGTNIQSIVYDGSNEMLYMTDFGSGSLYVVKPGSNTLVANISLGAKSGPSALAVDTSNGSVYVTVTGAPSFIQTETTSSYSYHPAMPNITIVDTKTNAIVKTISIGTGIIGNPIYVMQNNRIYFTLSVSSSTRILGIDDRTNSIVFNSTGVNVTIPDSMIYDPQSTCLYVAGGNSPIVSVASS